MHPNATHNEYQVICYKEQESQKKKDFHAAGFYLSCLKVNRYDVYIKLFPSVNIPFIDLCSGEVRLSINYPFAFHYPQLLSFKCNFFKSLTTYRLICLLCLAN